MSKPKLYQPVIVTVANQANLDVAIVKAVLAKVGLRNEGQISAFSTQHNFGDLVTYFLGQIHQYKNWYAETAKIARLKGSVTATVNVAVEIIASIKTFLGQVVKEVKDRAVDADRQVGTGFINAGDGINKNSLESLNDLDRGGGRALYGTFNAMTAPVGSDRFNQGLNNMSDGLVQFGKGLGKMFIQTPADATVMFGGRLVSAWQTMNFLEAIGRELTANEIGVLTGVFGSSVEYGAIRIKEGYAGLLNIGKDNGFTLYNNQQALTHGNTIYMKNTSPSRWNEVLVHETTHVWQNQNGGTDYMLEALYAQATAGYGYGDDIFNKKKTWALLNPEQQGQLIQDAYVNDYFLNGGWSNVRQINDSQGNGIPAAFMINYMNQVKPHLRGGQGAT